MSRKLYVRDWDGQFVELPRRKKSVDWKFVLLWGCLLLGVLVGYVMNI